MDGSGVQGASGSPASKSLSKPGNGGVSEREGGRKENGNKRQSRDCRLIYGGFPFNEIVSVTEPVKGP